MPLNLIFITPGNYTIEDNGIPGDNTSVIKDGSGAVIYTFVHPADSLGFTVTATGVNITVNLTESLGAANLTIGSLTDQLASPASILVNRVQTTGTVTLVATGSIGEAGSDVGSDIIAGQLVLSAQTGVGSGANALETQVSSLEAETTTGGIALRNVGSVQIGGITDQVDGLDVLTSGDIALINTGTILLADDTGAETVHGGSTSGNVSLIANGFDADIIATIDNDAISAGGGSIALQAGRDIGFGIIGTDFDNDVRARGSVTIQAGRDFLIDGFSDLASDDFGANTGGNAVIGAGRNIHVRNIAGTDGSLAAGGSAGADLILSTGAGGAVILDAPSSAALSSSSGDVTVNTDRVLIAAASGISAGAGIVTLRPATSGREMILGSAGDAAQAVELSDAELDRIFASALILGSDTTGNVQVTAAISPANAPAVVLASSEDIIVRAAITTTSALSLYAGNSIIHQSGAISTTTFFGQVDNLGNDGGTGGSGLLLGTVTGSSIALNGSADADILRGAEGVAQTVRGFDGNDTITSSGEGYYYGDGGNDTIFAGLSSGIVPEVLDGGAGIDTLDTTSFAGSYSINMATGVSGFSYESLFNFENLVTGDGADTIIGTAAANTITTNGGLDVVNAGAGNDTLRGGLGNDTLDGSLGFDVAVFSGTSGSYNWTHAGQTTHITGPDGSDTLIEIERMQFSNATYAYTSTGYADPTLFAAGFGSSAAAGGWSDQRSYPRLVADVDGNGLPDLVGFGSGGVYVALTDGGGASGPANLVLDYFGSSGPAGGWTDNRYFPRTLADINGDNRADVVGFGDAGVYAALADGSGGFGSVFLAKPEYGSAPSAGGWSDNRLFPRSLADVNGDGLDDIVGFGDGGTFVSLATGGGNFGATFLGTSGFGASVASGGWNDDNVYARTLADINSDGRADIVGFGSGGVHVAFAQENGTFGTAAFVFAGFGTEPSAGGWTNNDLFYRTVGDVDGDGNADLVGFGDAGVHVAYGNGNGGFTAGGLVLAAFGSGASAGGWTSNNLFPRMLVDMNDDSVVDIVGFGDGGVFTALSHTDWVVV